MGKTYAHADSCNGQSFLCNAMLCANTRALQICGAKIYNGIEMNHTIMSLKTMYTRSLYAASVGIQNRHRTILLMVTKVQV
jgi:hypothetical protein